MDSFAASLLETEVINEEDCRVLKMAALLHDIGHFPFSHMIRRWDSPKGRFPRHEDMARVIINSGELASLIDDKNDRNKIVQLITGVTDNPIFGYLMSSDVDVDRLDYLIRDAYHAGVTYGGIDLDRIAETISHDEKGICFMEKGIQAVENFLLARYHMYDSLYNHRTVVGFRLLLQKIHEQLVEQGRMYDSDTVSKLSDDEWNGYTDWYLLSVMMKNRRVGGTLSDMICDFFGRIPLELVDSETSFDRASVSEKYMGFQELSSIHEMERFSESCGVDSKWILYEEVNSEFTKIEEQARPLRIQLKSGSVQSYKDYRPQLASIAKNEIRLYTRKKYADKVGPALEKYLLH
jgi:HD superfamily phosphohydrolase